MSETASSITDSARVTSESLFNAAQKLLYSLWLDTEEEAEQAVDAVKLAANAAVIPIDNTLLFKNY